MTTAATVSQWSRRFVLTGAVFFLVWNVALVGGIGRSTSIILGLLGFVFHTIFGKAYSLVPTYFDRSLTTDRLLAPHFLSTVSGSAALAIGTEFSYSVLTVGGAVLWTVGVLLFLGTLFVTLRGNLTGSETSTGTHNEHRETVDRIANIGTPVALLSLGGGSVGFAASQLSLGGTFVAYTPRWVHLIAVGSATLLVFSLGFRLLPRFLSTTPPTWLVGVVIPAGILGPVLLFLGLPNGTLLQAGAVVQSAAMGGYGLLVFTLLTRTDRSRVGYGAILAGAISGSVVVLFGLLFAFEGLTGQYALAHQRVAIFGFLGLTIVGISYQFYPPAVFDGFIDENSTLPSIGLVGRDGRLNGKTIARTVTLFLCLAVLFELTRLAGTETFTIYGYVFATIGALGHLGLLYGIFCSR